MGLILFVYRSQALGDCTNDGLSSRHGKLCVTKIITNNKGVLPVDGPFEPDGDMPEVYLREHVKGSACLVPPDYENGKWFMAGGNYAGTSDSRFCDATELLTGKRLQIISIHDRVEEY